MYHSAGNERLIDNNRCETGDDGNCCPVLGPDEFCVSGDCLINPINGWHSCGECADGYRAGIDGHCHEYTFLFYRLSTNNFADDFLWQVLRHFRPRSRLPRSLVLTIRSQNSRHRRNTPATNSRIRRLESPSIVIPFPTRSHLMQLEVDC